MDQATKCCATLSCVGTIASGSGSGSDFSIKFAKGNKMHLTNQRQGWASDGRTIWMWYASPKEYYEDTVDPETFQAPLFSGLEPFFRTSPFTVEPGVRNIEFHGTQAQEISVLKPGVKDYFWKLIFAKEGHLIGALQGSLDLPDAIISIRYRDFKFDVPLQDSAFKWVPPKDFSKKSLAAQNQLLTVGSTAPDFNLVGLDGKTHHLKDLLKKHKVVWLNFWFLGCAPCREEFPHLDSISKKYSSKGLGIYSLNLADSVSDIRKYIESKRFSFKVLLDSDAKGVIKNYKVQAFPTSYLVGQDGKIIYAGVAFQQEAVLAELEKLLR